MSHEQKPRPKGLVWEQPLGTVRGILEEPGPRFVDPYAAEERKAIQEVKGGNTTQYKRIFLAK